MIEDLIARLEAEAQAEQDQKTWCDENMKNTQDERDAAQNKIDGYNALHMEKSTLADQLTEQMLTLSQDIADLNKALNDETQLRAKEKESNEKVITDSTTGKSAIETAINVRKLRWTSKNQSWQHLRMSSMGSFLQIFSRLLG